jgi:hypothetical protein
MTSAKEMARIFQAAADGVMEPYHSWAFPAQSQSQLAPGNLQNVQIGPSFSSASYDLAKSIAGAMRAIAAVYRTIAETEEKGPDHA